MRFFFFWFGQSCGCPGNARAEADDEGSDQYEQLRICEGAFPNLYRGAMPAIFDWIDACAEVSSSSSTRTDDRCFDQWESAMEGFDRFAGRMIEALEWLEENG